MKLKITTLLIALILSIGYVSAQIINDGVYAIQNAPQVEGSIYDKFITNPGSAGAIMTMKSNPDTVALGSDSTILWMVKGNGDNFNFSTLDEQFLASSDGAKGVLLENTEENRNSNDAGALVNIIDRGTGLRFETNTASNGIRAWNGRRTGGSQVGMGGSAADGYFWSLVRIAGLPGAPSDLTLSSTLIENGSPAGSVLGTLSATDDTEGDVLTYSFEEDSIYGADNDAFMLVSDTLKVIDSVVIDTQNKYHVLLKVTDASGLEFKRAFTISVYTGLYDNDGIYAIRNIGNPKFMTNPGSLGGILKMTEGSIADSAVQWIVKKNGVGFNIASLDEQFLAASDGAKGVVIENVEANRNDADSGALVTVSILDKEYVAHRFESTPGGVLKGWNGQRGGNTQVGMGSTASNKYEWIFIRLGHIPGAPSDLSLSATSIEENNDAGAVIGELSAMDPTPGDSLIYSFEADTVTGVDNDAFTITGNSLSVNASTDFETKSEYKIKIAVADTSGLVYRRAFVITVIDVNENQAPTAIELSSESILENEAVGTVVGTLSATDPDGDTNLTYTIGGTDAASFSIDGTELKSAEMFDFETKESYSISITVSDGELTFSKDFTIAIEDVDDNPVLGAIELEKITFYPNPVVNTLKISGLSTNGTVSLYTVSGTLLKVAEVDATNNSLDLTSLPSGIYLFKLVTPNGEVVRRIAK
ncbi:MAG: cadherin domain-containing protein [Cyclobacteriaceae bacterium]